MTAAWLRKELREHGWAFLAWWLFAAAVYGLFLFILVTRESRSSWFEATRNFTAAWSVVGAVWLAGRLIRREYASRSQLFLEALPITRWRVLTLKLLIGATMSGLSVLLAVALTALISQGRQVLSAELILFITLRLVSTVLFAWALAAMAAVMGRYRVPLMLFLAVALVALAQFTSLDVTQEGPFRLLSDDLPYENRQLPLRALLTVWIGFAVCTATTYAFVVAKDGALTVQLSDRMSHREKVYVTVVLLAFSAGVATLSEAKQPEPFRLSDPIVSEVGKARVELAWEPDVPLETAQAITERVATSIEAARQWLQLESVASLALIPTRELDPDEMQSAYVSKASGSVMRANLASPKLDVALLTSLALHDVISETHDDGAMKERLHWVLDGLVHLRGETDAHGEAGRELLWLRAAYAGETPPLSTFLQQWDLGDELRGSCIHTALAATLLETLKAQRGEEAVQRLARRALDEEAARSRLVFAPSPEALLEETAQISLTELERHWHAALEAHRTRLADRLAAIPRAQATAALSRLSGRTFELRHSVTLSPAPGEPVRYSLRYDELGPFDFGVLDENLELQQALANGEVTPLPVPLVEGDRWMWAFNVPIAQLRCSVRPLVERRVIR